MIAKITRGSRSGDIAAYLHGAGKANEHKYIDGQGVEREGGIVIGGNLGREGDTIGRGWAQDLRAASSTRPDIKKPVWQMSLRSAPGDRSLSDREWASAGQSVAERMGYAEHPWVMVRHGDDHVHIVVSRVSERGEVWHARQDFREAQRAATSIEKEYGLSQAPRQRESVRRKPAQERAEWRSKASELAERRTNVAPSRDTRNRVEQARDQSRSDVPPRDQSKGETMTPGDATKPRRPAAENTPPQRDTAARLAAAQRQAATDRSRDNEQER